MNLYRNLILCFLALLAASCTDEVTQEDLLLEADKSIRPATIEEIQELRNAYENPDFPSLKEGFAKISPNYSKGGGSVQLDWGSSTVVESEFESSISVNEVGFDAKGKGIAVSF